MINAFASFRFAEGQIVHVLSAAVTGAHRSTQVIKAESAERAIFIEQAT